MYKRLTQVVLVSALISSDSSKMICSGLATMDCFHHIKIFKVERRIAKMTFHFLPLSAVAPGCCMGLPLSRACKFNVMQVSKGK